MVRKKSVTFGFGSSRPRFARLGMHPELDTSNKKVNSRLGPGQYNVKLPECSVKQPDGSPWARMAELEEFSKYLGFRNAPILVDRHFQKIHRGPGTYNIPDDIDRRKSNSVKQNLSFTTEKRFVEHGKKGEDSPPPCIHFLNIFTPSSKAKKDFGRVPRFEWDGLVPRFRDNEPSYKKPPNLYKIPDPDSMESRINRVVSVKGPYCLFTGERDGTSIKNHFAPPNTIVPDTYYIKPSTLDYMLTHPSKTRYGKFLREDRFPEKKYTVVHTTPGPGQYDCQTFLREVDESLHPFNSSLTYPRPQTKWTIHPGPGRYSVKFPIECRKKPKQSWVFESKIERVFFPKPDVYTDFIE